MRRPRVLITLDEGEALRRGVPFPAVTQKAAYGHAVARAGGLPLWVAPAPGVDELPEALLAEADALVVTGGDFDVPPELYGARAEARRVDAQKPARTSFELALVRGAITRDLPVLGVCGGMQLLAVAFGGTLVQDIEEAHPGALAHEQASSPSTPAHDVILRAGSPLEVALGRDRIEVNSTHHQAVASPGALEVWGTAPDGLVEAVGDARGRRVGVQWHPELLDDGASRAIYRMLVEAARSERS